LFPYGVQLSQPLSVDEMTRVARSLLKDNSDVSNFTWKSDEAHFHPDDYITTEILAKVVNDFVPLYKVDEYSGHRIQMF
jgi:hypothetical protein